MNGKSNPAAEKKKISSKYVTGMNNASCKHVRIVNTPLTPHFYTVKLGFTGVVIEAVLTSTHNLCFEQKYENCQKNQLKIVIFTAVKNPCMLHGHVFVMVSIPMLMVDAESIHTWSDRRGIV